MSVADCSSRTAADFVFLSATAALAEHTVTHLELVRQWCRCHICLQISQLEAASDTQHDVAPLHINCHVMAWPGSDGMEVQ